MGGHWSCCLGVSLCVLLVYTPPDLQAIHISMGIRGSYSCSFISSSQSPQHHKSRIMLDVTADVVRDSWATKCLSLAMSIPNTMAHFHLHVNGGLKSSSQAVCHANWEHRLEVNEHMAVAESKPQQHQFNWLFWMWHFFLFHQTVLRLFLCYYCLQK